MTQWSDTTVSRTLGVRYPIVQGPFGGGQSSAALVAAVSNAGGLGSYGARGLTPGAIREVVAEIRQRTSSPFAVNLWVSTQDDGAQAVTREEFDAALAPILPLYRELGVEPPRFERKAEPRVDDQAAALIELRVPVVSFVFGVPPRVLVDECHRLGIVTIGTATSVDEAIALEAGGVHLIVASGSEAGGHRASFLKSAESNLMGTFALVPQVADAVRVPIIAAGGIADGRTVAAALMLGASGVQVGTAFLACEESNAPPGHRAALFGPERQQTLLTRGFTGRLARGLRNRMAALVDSLKAPLPYPRQLDLLAPLTREALSRDRVDLVSLWAGEAAPLVKHRRATDVFDALVSETTRAFALGATGP